MSSEITSEKERGLRGGAGILIVAASVCLIAAGLGAATSYLKGSTAVTAASRPGSSDDTFTRLKDYAQSNGADHSAAGPPGGELLPDVSTMADRLAARLKSAPEDGKGWRTLGWSYYHIGRYKEATAAYAKAVELDPNSFELKLEYDEAKAKVAESESAAAAPPVHTAATNKAPGEPSAEQVAAYQAMPPQDRDTAIRSMVDGLAARLENAPRDLDGWTKLMRSRVVLGEKDVATTALRKALDVFKDDAAASGKITAAANELGLKVE
jgi:cytochrome c-type biogenesis protein CcmH/NrfG